MCAFFTFSPLSSHEQTNDTGGMKIWEIMTPTPQKKKKIIIIIIFKLHDRGVGGGGGGGGVGSHT